MLTFSLITPVSYKKTLKNPQPNPPLNTTPSRISTQPPDVFWGGKPAKSPEVRKIKNRVAAAKTHTTEQEHIQRLEALCREQKIPLPDTSAFSLPPLPKDSPKLTPDERAERNRISSDIGRQKNKWYIAVLEEKLNQQKLKQGEEAEMKQWFNLDAFPAQ